MIIVTGGAGFIGSCLVHELNQRGKTDILIVDQTDKKPPFANLANKKFSRFIEKDEFLGLIKENALDKDIQTLFHLGATSSTTLSDKAHYMENNFQYSVSLAEFAAKNNIRFIYASSAATYGDGSNGFSDLDENTRRLKPLNFYGLSKHLFDLWILDNGLEKKMAGLKYFNVYGPNEYHKQDMQSLICKSFDRVKTEKKIRLFKSCRPDYPDGGQKRDFIYVKDAVRATLFFMDNVQANGIYNVGTGKARTWNDLAYALFESLSLKPSIEYIPMPENIRDKYQYFTQADINKLCESSFDCSFYSLEKGVKDYSRFLENRSYI